MVGAKPMRTAMSTFTPPGLQKTREVPRRAAASSLADLWYELWYDLHNLLFILDIWWRRRESNPRPLVRRNQLYMLSIRLLI